MVQRSLYIDQSKAKEKCLIDNISSIDLMISKDIDGSTDWKMQPRTKFIFSNYLHEIVKIYGFK